MNSIGDDVGRTLHAVASSKRVWTIHVVANALLMVAFFYWTRIPEETGWQFTLTVVAGVMIAFFTLWLHCATLDYFRPSSEKVFRSSLRRGASRVPAFLLWALIFGFILRIIGQTFSYQEQLGGWARHMLPLFLRRQVAPRTMFAASHWLIWCVYFFLWPILFLPVGAQVAVRNFRGFLSRSVFRPVTRLSFWIVYAACFVIGGYIPYKLAWMVPTRPAPLSDQEWSMVARLGSAYLLMVSAWIVLCAAMMIACERREESAEENPEREGKTILPSGAESLPL